MHACMLACIWMQSAGQLVSSGAVLRCEQTTLDPKVCGASSGSTGVLTVRNFQGDDSGVVKSRMRGCPAGANVIAICKGHPILVRAASKCFHGSTNRLVCGPHESRRSGPRSPSVPATLDANLVGVISGERRPTQAREPQLAPRIETKPNKPKLHEGNVMQCKAAIESAKQTRIADSLCRACKQKHLKEQTGSSQIDRNAETG